VVHHGGYGIAAAGIRTGIPTLVILHIADQFYWEQRVHELGVGLQPIRPLKLNSQALAASLSELVQNEELKVTASKLGEQVRSENRIENAEKLIVEIFVCL
jgi:sterol 3beta-glucosyltransferase